MDGTGAEGAKVGKPPWNPPPCPARLGWTTVPLPFGGVASTDAERIRRPLVRPFWLLAMALVMPIYHEEVERVAAGIGATWLSARRAGLEWHWDFFVLSR